MDTQEKDKILLSSKLLEAREHESLLWEDPYSDMTPDEKSKLIIELMALRKADQERMDSLLQKIDKLTESLLSSNEETRMLRLQLKGENALEKKIASLEEQLKLERKHRYGSRSQKGRGKSDVVKSVSHEEDKDNFDGTVASLSSNEAAHTAQFVDADKSDTVHEKEVRLFRQGMKYRRMTADSSVSHKSDRNRLPQGAVIIAVENRYSYDQISQIVEHNWEVLRYKMPDGKIYEGYFPSEGAPLHVDKVPGTHASANFLSCLAFNKYVLDTPLYREMYRITDEKMRLSRMTLTNWLHKGSHYISEVVKHLMEICIHDGANLNGDETWERVKSLGKYTKKYIWCIVNKETRTVIYRYENGSRGRDVLRHIIGDKKIRSFQSDGYNVYMYLDDKMLDVDHICCMAHARAKFKYAFEQGDADAGYFLDRIGELYKLEEEYRSGKLSSEQIGICRQGLKTKEILIGIRSKLDALLGERHPARGELMEKALRYLNTFWQQLFTYLKDGNYSIDNTLAERCIRPLAGERKNSLFFGSDKMAMASAAYHTVITTCRMQGISALEYLKRFFREIIMGRRDYENLLPQTIGILSK